MAITSQNRGYRRRLYASNKEATFNSADTLLWVFDSYAEHPIIRETMDTITDATLAADSEFPRRQYPLGKHCEISGLTLPADSLGLGLFGTLALGADASAAVGGGTGDYLHTITMVGAGTFPGSVTLEEHANSSVGNTVLDRKVTGVVVDSFNLSWGRTGWAKLTLDMFGTGSGAAGGTITESTLNGGNGPTSHAYIPCNKITIFIKAAATEGDSEWGGTFTPHASAGVFNTYSGFTNLSDLLESASFTYKNNYDRERARSAGTSTAIGIVGTQPEMTQRTASLELTWASDTTTDDYVLALLNATSTNNAEYTIIIEWVTDRITSVGESYEGGAIVLPLCGIQQTPTSSTGLENIRDTLTFFPKYETAGTAFPPVKMYVTTTTAVAFDGA